MFFKQRRIVIAMSAIAGMTFSAGALATNGIIQAGNGMAAHGVGGAGIAHASEASAGMDNPALISQTGNSVALGFSIFMPDRTVDSTGISALPATFKGTVDSDSKMFAIPQVAFTSKINDAVSWGVMLNALGGMNTDYRTGPMGDPGSGTALSNTSPQSVNLQGIILAPTMSFNFTKDLSVGASILFGYSTLTARNLFGQGAAGTNEGSATGYGVKLGADWKVAPGIEFGAMVQPKMSMEEMDWFKTFLGGFGFTGDAQLTLPNEIGVGAKFGIGSKFDIVADVLFYQWSDVDVFEFFGWEDQVVYKVGAEFRPTDRLTLRGGVNYGESPIKGGNRTKNGSMDAAFANYPFPAISEWHFTVGLGFKYDKNLAINAYYLYSPEASETATGNSVTCSTPATCTVPGGLEISMTQHAFGLGVNYEAK